MHISKVSFPVRKWWKVACWGSRSHNATAVFFGSFQRLINPSLAHKVLYQAKRINKVVDFLPFDLNNVAEANKACDKARNFAWCSSACIIRFFTCFLIKSAKDLIDKIGTWLKRWIRWIFLLYEKCKFFSKLPSSSSQLSICAAGGE